jgi:aspartyl-tRNA(Asn)/glutamyl-tRNA(Gln) amidotransferase subunit A
MSGPIWSWSLRAVRDAIAAGAISPVDAVEAVLARIAQRSCVNAYITLCTEQALAAAREAERIRARGDALGPLFGVPIALKDNIATAGVRTTAGSPLREGWIPDEDADVVRALRSAGAIVIGKNSLYEFAYGAAHPQFGETLNPWDLSLTCGGSSNGSAAAVADGQAFAAIGTDTGGSIRIPAAMCGVVGLKLSRRRVPNRGVIPVSPALDVVGPLTRSVEDAGLVLAGMGGRASSAEPPPRRFTVGVPSDCALGVLAAPVGAAIERARQRLEAHGCVLRDVALPDLTLAREVMWTIASADAAEYHREGLRTRAADYCDQVRRNFLGGTMIPAVDYIRAQRLRDRLAREATAVFAAVDVVLLPTLAVPPYRSGATSVVVEGVERPVLPLIMEFTPLANLTGQPAIVVPVDAPRDGLPPASVQLYGRHGQEETLMAAARLVEREAVALPG